MGVKPFLVGVKTEVNSSFATIGDGISLDAAIACAALGVNPGGGNVVNVTAFDQHIWRVDIVDAFGVEIQLCSRAFAAVVYFTVEDFDASAGWSEFDGIPPCIVDDAIAYGDVAGAAAFGKRYGIVPIPIAFKFESVIIPTYNFQAFEQASIGLRLVVPKARANVFHIGDRRDDGPFIGIGTNGQVAFVDADFVGGVFAAPQFNDTTR